jgi:hypothetical protein
MHIASLAILLSGWYFAQNQDEQQRYIHRIGIVRHPQWYLFVSHAAAHSNRKILLYVRSYIFFEGDASKQMALGEKVKADVHKLLSQIRSHLTGLARVNFSYFPIPIQLTLPTAFN